MVKSHYFQHYRSDRSEDLLFGLVTSILLHVILFLGSNYWLRAFAPQQKQDLSQPIPIEYVEVPPNQTKTPPPETSRRAARDSVAGGKAKLKRPVSAAKSAPVAPNASASKPAKTFLPKLTQPTAVLPLLSPQKPQSQPRKIAVDPPKIRPEPKPQQTAVTPARTPPEPKPKPPQTAVTPARTPPEPKPQQTAVTPARTPPEPKPQQTMVTPTRTQLEAKLPQTEVIPTRTPPLEPKPQQTVVTPTRTQLEAKLRQTALTPSRTPPLEPKPQQTALTPARTQLEAKLRQTALTPSRTPPLEPKPQQTVVTPARTQLEAKLRQTALTPSRTPPLEPKPQQTALTPARTQLEAKLRQTAVTPTRTPPLEPKPQQTALTPARTQLEAKLRQTAVTPTRTPPLEPKPQQTALTPTNIPPEPKPPKIAVAPTTTRPPVPLTRQENKNRLAAKSTNEQLETKTTPRTPSQVQPSRKSGASSRLGGPMSVSSRNFGGNYLAALPNSNRLNRDEEGVDARQDDMAAYWEQLKQQVKRQWIPELTQSSRQTVIHFTVSRSGQVSNLEIEQPSGFSVTDEAALKAIKRAAPFAPLPTTYTPNYINIQFTFIINVYGELDFGGG